MCDCNKENCQNKDPRQKKCNRCLKTKSFDDFYRVYKDKKPNYRASICIECKKAVDLEMAEELRLYRKEYGARPEVKIRRAQWFQDNYIPASERPPIIKITETLDDLKKCDKCEETKPWREYPPKLQRNPALKATCTACHRLARKEDKRKLKEANSKLSIEEIYEKYPVRNKKCSKCKFDKPIQEYYRDNSAKHCLMSNCKACVVQWREDNYEQVIATQKRIYNERYKGNPIRRQEATIRARNRLQNNIQARLKSNLRGRIRNVVKKGYKSAATMDLIGCSIDFLFKHLESQFEDWMTFENYGKPKYDGHQVWEIDHIIPCEFFNLEDPAQQRECFNWKNLQPLCAVKNRQKCDWIEIEGEMVRARTLKKKNPTD